MPFKSDKTPDQLAREAKEKSEALVRKAMKCLNQVARKRSTDPNIKKHIQTLISDELEPMAKGVGPGGG